jgi:crotonobetainyl-CoA:carnitine CoA-transferase CaiB-like acyl-CoA transferase
MRRTFLRDPTNELSGRVASAVGADGRRYRELAHLVRVSGAPLPPHRLAPWLGEHTEEVLAEVGFSVDDIQRMRAGRAIR